MTKSTNDHFYQDSCHERIYGYWAILAALVVGFFLFFIEQTLFWPHIFEELAKVLIIFFLILKITKKKSRILFTFGAWFIFILVENIFYLPQFIEEGNLALFYGRFLGPSILHLISFALLIIFSWKHKHLIWLALVINIFLHYFFNLGVLKFF